MAKAKPDTSGEAAAQDDDHDKRAEQARTEGRVVERKPDAAPPAEPDKKG